jgi:hypothetical protein
MSKKRKSNGKPGHKKSLKVEEEKSRPLAPAEEKPFDFGGLPDRDLKRNLGCG